MRGSNNSHVSEGRSPEAVLELHTVGARHVRIDHANAQAFEELTRLKRQLEIENAYLKNDALPPAALALPIHAENAVASAVPSSSRCIACA